MSKPKAGYAQCAGLKQAKTKGGVRDQCSRLVRISDIYCRQHRAQSTEIVPITFQVTTVQGLIPIDVMRIIAKQLPIRDILAISAVCKAYMNSIGNNPRFWNDVAQSRSFFVAPNTGIRALQRQLYDAELTYRMHHILRKAMRKEGAVIDREDREILSRHYGDLFTYQGYMNAIFNGDLISFHVHTTEERTSLDVLFNIVVEEYNRFLTRLFERDSETVNGVTGHEALTRVFLTVDELRVRLAETRSKMQEYELINLCGFPSYLQSQQVHLIVKVEDQLAAIRLRSYSRRGNAYHFPPEAISLFARLYQHSGQQRLPLSRDRLSSIYGHICRIYSFSYPTNQDRYVISDERHPIAIMDGIPGVPMFRFHIGGKSKKLRPGEVGPILESNIPPPLPEVPPAPKPLFQYMPRAQC